MEILLPSLKGEDQKLYTINNNIINIENHWSTLESANKSLKNMKWWECNKFNRHYKNKHKIENI